MSNIAIKGEKLSKLYKIGARRNRHDTLRDHIMHGVKSLFSRNGTQPSALDPQPSDHIWALKDVSFEIKHGEVVGFVGKNGAGKSTLLRILSRITEPTTGRAEIFGRIASLLEVGTGFHPELTGRENIYLNGAILGMKKWEIEKKFDEIVAFSEIEKFIDTPVKRYSSGMYVRLAFAVAAHLEPEILIVDEVLAVGDAAFQKKCLGKMENVAKEGRTVLFVSHNMAAIRSLCTKGVFLSSGRAVIEGSIDKIVEAYLTSVESMEVLPIRERKDRSGDGTARLVSLRIESADGYRAIRPSSQLKVTIEYETNKFLQHPSFLVSINDYSNVGIFLLNSNGSNGIPDVLPARGRVVCITEPINVTPGQCFLNVALRKGGALADHVQYAAKIDVEPDDVYASGNLPLRSSVLCVLGQKWFLEDIGSEESSDSKR